MLTTCIRPFFDNPQITRGVAYHTEGAVTVVSSGPEHIRARVQGTRSYTVKIYLVKNVFHVSCSCPHFEDYNLCKHLYAVFLEAQARNALSAVDPKNISLKMGTERVEKQRTSSDPQAYPAPPEKRVAARRASSLQEQDLYDELDEDFADSPQGDLLDEFSDMLNKNPFPQKRLASEPWRKTKRSEKSKTLSAWQELLSRTATLQNPSRLSLDVKFKDIPLDYLLTPLPGQGLYTEGLRVEIGHFSSFKNYSELKFRPLALSWREIPALKDALDRRILLLLFGSAQNDSFYSYRYGRLPSNCILPFSVQDMALVAMLETNRLFIHQEKTNQYLGPFRHQPEHLWRLHLELRQHPSVKNSCLLESHLKNQTQIRSANEILLATAGGFVFWKDLEAARLDDAGCFSLLVSLRATPQISVPRDQVPDFLEQYFSLPQNPPLALPAEFSCTELRCAPRPLFRLFKPDSYNRGRTLLGSLFFIYDDLQISAQHPAGKLFQKKSRTLILRDRSSEQGARQKLLDLQCKAVPDSWFPDLQGMLFSLTIGKMPAIVTELLAQGWRVEGEGVIYRRPGPFSLTVTSGLDWFDLAVRCDFEGTTIELPRILEALKKGAAFVPLGDGSLGLLPQEWLAKYEKFARLGEVQDDRIRFRKSQALIVDMLLQDQPQVTCDDCFEKIRRELDCFTAITARAEPAGFRGTLRPYQREGLGWFFFLQRLGFGGILADDMGLGKTVQVLALLLCLKKQGGYNAVDQKPSLVIAPRSVIFNWKMEARRFTPELAVLDFSAGGRSNGNPPFESYDLILATYGTLRRDVELLKNTGFNYVILDEAQAIKNASAITAKAVRLLKGSNRLALSGTPIENHLGELWSLFEFLNPGMLGSVSVFRAYAADSFASNGQGAVILQKALRPFILRRTKAQVAAELPKKFEETLYCEMEIGQRKTYNELRDYYRDSLMKKVERSGIKRSQIQILEALLRLRQVACHPGLVDRKRNGESSAKLEMLLTCLDEVLAEDHKALVFSQFTSLLAIVRPRLEKRGIVYEYLDGQTLDRQCRVERFQTDPGCKLFLISLKAGGIGLNLTAAEYVFLLDPWWNPAVEVQAVDRTHRIGQTKRVFAYRLICKDTVEEKVLELQKTKKALAESIITADNAYTRSIGLEELRLLLS